MLFSTDKDSENEKIFLPFVKDDNLGVIIAEKVADRIVSNNF